MLKHTLLVCALAIAAAVPARAQFLSTSSIGGTVVDASGSVMPGVAVVITSRALQGGSRQTTTDAAGRFQFLELPAGTYRVRFDVAGFQPFVRDDLQVTTGFAARVDPVMKVGGQSEAVTVSGASPIVDVTTTGGGQLLTGKLLNDEIPGSRLNSELGRVTPGLAGTSPPNIGLLGSTAAGGFTTYGETNFQMLVDGVNLLSGTFPDQVVAQDVEVRTFGSGPDVSSSGAVISVVVKPGGNDFHGRYEEQYQNDAVQSDNLDAALRAQLLTTGDSTKYYNDVNGDLGGRIVRDKLWFYGAYHERRNKRTATGFVMNAGPNLTIDPTSPPFLPTNSAQQWTDKLSYQPTSRWQLGAFFGRDLSITDGNLGAGTPKFTPYQSSTVSRTGPTTYRGEIRAVLSDHLLFNTQFGRTRNNLAYYDTPGNDAIVSRFNLATQEVSGGGIATGGSAAETKRFDSRLMAQGNLTFIPRGRAFSNHEFKAGYRVWLQSGSTGDEPDHPAGNYQLVYNTIGGVPYTPVQINTYNFPVTQEDREDTYALYLSDRWQAADRLTLNLGVRFDHHHAWIPGQTKVQGTFGSAGTFPEFDANTWNNFAPRVGVAWDLGGDGKTLVKATYSRYNVDMADTFAAPFNKNGVVVTTYKWTDPTHCDCYVPGTVDLNTNGGAFVSISGAANNIFNPDLKSPREHELTASLEREVMANTSVRFLYVYKRIVDDITTVNILRPYSAYDIALPLPTPSSDGTIQAGTPTTTVYDFEPSFKGSAFVGNQMQNRPDSGADHYQTIELTLNRRPIDKWGVITSLLATKNHRWLAAGNGASLAIPQNPNDLYFPVDDTWTVLYKITGTYSLPYDMQLGGVFDIQRGLPGQRTALFSTAQSGFVTIRLEPFGAEMGPVRSEANIRLTKRVKLQRGSLLVSLDALNAFNSNSTWTATFASGSTFGNALSIQSPRVFRFGLVYEF